MAATSVIVAEKREVKTPLINVLFGYWLIGLLISANPSDLVLDLIKIGIVGGLLASFLGFVDPVNRLCKWLMPRAFGTRDSVSWTLDAMGKMPALMTAKVDLTPSTERIGQWAKNSYYSPYLSSSRAKIVAETYFGIGLIVMAILPLFQLQPIADFLRVLFIVAAVVILVSALFDFLDLISRAHIVAVFEMLITFGIPISNFEGLKKLLKSGNWSEAQSWILRELKLPLAPWHWISIKPKYSKVIDKVDELAEHWGVLKRESITAETQIKKFSNDLKVAFREIVEKADIKTSGNTLVDLATACYEQNIISKQLYEGTQIVEQVAQLNEADEIFRLIGRHLSLIVPKMKDELQHIAKGLV